MVMTIDDVPALYRDQVRRILDNPGSSSAQLAAKWDSESPNAILTGVYMTDAEAWTPEIPSQCVRCQDYGSRQSSVDHVFTWLCSDCLRDRFGFEGDKL
jgi:hypothetical protein